MTRDHTKLKVFHLADALVLAVYPLLHTLPADERFALGAQLRRAVLSVPTNIVEGCARASRREYLRFLYIARGSAAEVDYLLDVAARLALLSTSSVQSPRDLASQVARALQRLITAVTQLPDS